MGVCTARDYSDGGNHILCGLCRPLLELRQRDPAGPTDIAARPSDVRRLAVGRHVRGLHQVDGGLEVVEDHRSVDRDGSLEDVETYEENECVAYG
jgi:hypothetical protein